MRLDVSLNCGVCRGRCSTSNCVEHGDFLDGFGYVCHNKQDDGGNEAIGYDCTLIQKLRSTKKKLDHLMLTKEQANVLIAFIYQKLHILFMMNSIHLQFIRNDNYI